MNFFSKINQIYKNTIFETNLTHFLSQVFKKKKLGRIRNTATNGQFFLAITGSRKKSDLFLVSTKVFFFF